MEQENDYYNCKPVIKAMLDIVVDNSRVEDNETLLKIEKEMLAILTAYLDKIVEPPIVSMRLTPPDLSRFGRIIMTFKEDGE